jgi:hypothetical protein
MRRLPLSTAAPVIDMGHALRCAVLASLVVWPILLGVLAVLP